MTSGDQLKALEIRLNALERFQKSEFTKLSSVQKQMQANTEALQEFIELGKGLKVGLKFLGILERMFVWIAKAAAAAAVLWGFWRYVVQEAIKNSTK